MQACAQPNKRRLSKLKKRKLKRNIIAVIPAFSRSEPAPKLAAFYFLSRKEHESDKKANMI